MNRKALAPLIIALAGCGDASQDVGTQRSSNDWSQFGKNENSDLELSDILLKKNWEVLDTTTWTDGENTTEYCISWKFVHQYSFRVSEIGSFLLLKGLVEQKEEDGYIYDCSHDLKTYKLYFVEKNSGAKSLISTITRVAETIASPQSTTSAAWTPSPTVAPSPVWTPVPLPASTPRPSTGTFVIKMRVGTKVNYIKTYTYSNIWIEDSLRFLGSAHTSKLEQSGTTYTWDLTKTNSNCQSDGTNCTAYCYHTMESGTANLITGKRYIEARYWGLTTCSFYSDLVD